MTANGETENLQLALGLISSAHKYLTAENFQNEINASGPNLKKKQTWSLEQNSTGTEVYFKSHKGKYLATDKRGTVTCHDDSPGEDNAFQVEATLDGGKWAIKGRYGSYLGVQGGEVNCDFREIREASLWTVHLVMHPQINLYNTRRKKYASLEGDEVWFTKLIPWGQMTLITLVFHEGGYALMVADGRYLSYDGKLQDKISKQELFTIEFYAGKIAFKARHNNNYLAPVGVHGRLETRKNTVSPDEQFSFVDAHPQISLKFQKKEKYVSGKQGLQLSANQTDIEETEIFQLEMDKCSDKVYFRNNKDKYWRLDGNGIKADAPNNSTPASAFGITWNGRLVQLSTHDNKAVSVVLTGHLQSGSTPADFVFGLTNRPVIVFRGEYGFLGIRNDRVEGNRSKHDVFILEDMDGAYAVKAPGKNGKYWCIGEDKKLLITSDAPVPFLIQLLPNSKLVIKPESGGDYITSDHVGIVTATETAINMKSKWEY